MRHRGRKIQRLRPCFRFFARPKALQGRASERANKVADLKGEEQLRGRDGNSQTHLCGGERPFQSLFAWMRVEQTNQIGVLEQVNGREGGGVSRAFQSNDGVILGNNRKSVVVASRLA